MLPAAHVRGKYANGDVRLHPGALHLDYLRREIVRVAEQMSSRTDPGRHGHKDRSVKLRLDSEGWA